jgi:choline kinase
MKAIILAAGRGSRLEELTANNPKCMIQVKGKPMLGYQIDSLRKAGITEIGIVTGYLNETIQISNVKYFHNPRWEETNMVVSLTCARDWLVKEECIVCYSDILYPSETIEKLIAFQSEFVLPYNTDWLKVWSLRFSDPLSDAESFRIDEKGLLTEIGNKASSVEEIEGQYMGILKISTSTWSYIEEFLNSLPEIAKDKMDVTTLLKNLINRSIKIETLAIHGNWFEVDNKIDRDIYESHPEIQINFI